MIRTGTIAIRVEAIAVVVYFIDRRDNETPRKGPKKAPIDIPVIANLFFRAFITFLQYPEIVKITVKPAMPAITLI